MKIIRTHITDPFSLRGFERDQVYNGLDVCATAEILSPMREQLDVHTQATYDLERSLQGPVLEMRLRGVLVDQARKLDVIDDLWDSVEVLEHDLNRIVLEGVGLSEFNWRSPKDLQRLFYGELGLPPVRRAGRITIDDDARESLQDYPIAIQLVRHINTIAELSKKITVLQTEIDNDGRIRTSYNIAGTSTGRFSSSLSEFGTGGNLQNIEESLRSIFIADRGYKFAKFDGKACQSRIVGAIEWNLFGDGTYLDACESGDPHTSVARLTWPDMGWTGDLRVDRAIAERPFYRHHDHRYVCKKLGHGSNFGGQPPALAAETKLPVHIVAQFQPKYYVAFPAHLQRLAWTAEQLRTKGYLISLGGRKRYFFARRTERKTVNEAAAYDPQDTEAYVVNTAMLNIWRKNIAIVMFQDHDALTFMYPETEEDRILPLLREELIIPIPLAGGRELRIPYDCEIGWNKGKYCCGERKAECKGCQHKPNPDGLREYTGHDPRRRQPEVGLMDRLIHRSHRKPRRTANLATLGRDIDNLRSAGAESVDADE